MAPASSYLGLVLRMPSVCKNAPHFVMNGLVMFSLYMAIFLMDNCSKSMLLTGNIDYYILHILVDLIEHNIVE